MLVSFLLTSNLNVYQQKTRIVIYEVTLVEARLSCMVGIRREGEGNFDARIFVYSREKLFIFLAFPKSLSSSLSSTYHAGLSSQSLHTWLPCGAESNHTMA